MPMDLLQLLILLFSCSLKLSLESKTLNAFSYLLIERHWTSFQIKLQWWVKGALSGLMQFSANESLLKMMKNPFYFTFKALFILKIFKLLS